MNMKRILAMLIVMVMMVSLVPMAFAQNNTNTTDDGNNTSNDGTGVDASGDNTDTDGDTSDDEIDDDDDESEDNDGECTSDAECYEDEFCDSGECEDLDEDDESEDKDELGDAMDDAQDKINDAEEKIADAEEKLAEREADGEDVSESLAALEDAKKLLAQAIEAFEAGNYEEAEDLAEDAKDLADDAKEVEDDDKDESGDDDEADEEESEKEDDEEDVEVFSNSHGAEMRLLQLEQSIERNVLRGNHIVEDLTAKGKNVTELEVILVEMDALIPEIQALDLDQTSDILAQEFVAIKKTARDLAKDFKTSARGLLTDEEVAELREKVKNKKSDREAEFEAKIKKSRNAYNKEQTQALLERFGLDGDDLAEKIASGELTVDDIKAKFSAMFEELSKEQKVRAVQKSREDEARKAVFKRSAVQKSDLAELRIKERIKDYDRRAELRAKLADGSELRIKERVKDGVLEREVRIKDRLSDRLALDDSDDDEDDNSDDEGE